MKNTVLRTFVLLATSVAILILAGCGDGEEARTATAVPASTAPSSSSAAAEAGKRWYGPKQVRLGQIVYRENCAECHGLMGQGGANWREKDASGDYPPPPLNGSGHSWHHPFEALKEVVVEGGPRNMPAWGDRLSPEKVDAVLAYVTSLWPDDVYRTWETRVQRR